MPGGLLEFTSSKNNRRTIMLTLHATERHCATCHHWIGVRATESDGYIYAPRDVEGICRTIEPPRETKFCCATTLPHATCHQWQPWIVMEAVAPQAYYEIRSAI